MELLFVLGIVVGWGFDENRKLSNKLMQAQMPVVSTIKCIYSNREFFLKYTFENNFCAGFRNGKWTLLNRAMQITFFLQRSDL